MRTPISLISLLTLCLGTASTHANAADICMSATNLVANCGVETGDFTSWALSGTGSASIYDGIYYGIENYNQYSGTYAAYMGAVGGQMILSQTFTGTAIGSTYTVSFRLFNDTTPDTGYINNFNASLGNTTGVSLTQLSAGAYTLYTFQAAATSTSSVLSFSSRNDAGFWNLDSIQVIQTATPEPSTLGILFGASMLLTGVKVIRWRKRLSGQRLI